MKKKLLSVLAVLFTISICAFSLTGCLGLFGDKPTISSEAGIVITGHEFEVGAEISFCLIDDQTEVETVKSALQEQDYQKETDIYILDISVVSAGQKIQPSGKVSVSIPTSLIPNLNTNLLYVVFHIKDDGAIERLSATVTDTDVWFETNSFSYFVLAEPNLEPIGPEINNSTDLKPTDKDDHYTSVALNLVTEINGSYTVDRAFTLDAKDPNKRIYDDLYLYQYDYFFMISGDYKDIWCRLSDRNDLEYVEVEKSEGEDVKVNVKVSGIYKLIFDTVTKSFDVEYKSEITTPVYEEILKCEIGYLDDSKEMVFVKMVKDGNELAITNIHFDIGQAIWFYSEFTHTSWYKTTIDESCVNKYVHKWGEKPSSEIIFIFGGTYNLYLNPKTYVVRVEAVSIDNDGYSAIIFDENGQEQSLQPADQTAGYIFTFEKTVTGRTVGNVFVVTEDLPVIYNASYQPYNLTLTEESEVFVRFYDDDIRFKQAGTYIITINLQTFEMGLTLLAE